MAMYSLSPFATIANYICHRFVIFKKKKQKKKEFVGWFFAADIYRPNGES